MKNIIETIDFGRWMKSKRKKMKLSQEELARIIISNKNTISRYETGDRFPPLDVAETIVKVLGGEFIILEKQG